MIIRMDRISNSEKLQELMSNIRHYSSLRFAMFTVYFAVTGGLLMTFFDCEFSKQYPQLLWLFMASGVMITLAFFIFEVTLDNNLSRLWDAVADLVGQGDHLVKHRKRWKGIWVPFATYGIFACTLAFWLFVSWRFYPCGV